MEIDGALGVDGGTSSRRKDGEHKDACRGKPVQLGRGHCVIVISVLERSDASGQSLS